MKYPMGTTVAVWVRDSPVLGTREVVGKVIQVPDPDGSPYYAIEDRYGDRFVVERQDIIRELPDLSDPEALERWLNA